MQDVQTAKYKIIGLVDIFDEQGVITGQYPVGSVQELDVEKGTQAVAEGRAEAVGEEEAVVTEATEPAEAAVTEATEPVVTEATEPAEAESSTGETAQGEVE